MKILAFLFFLTPLIYCYLPNLERNNLEDPHHFLISEDFLKEDGKKILKNSEFKFELISIINFLELSYPGQFFDKKQYNELILSLKTPYFRFLPFVSRNTLSEFIRNTFSRFPDSHLTIESRSNVKEVKVGFQSYSSLNRINWISGSEVIVKLNNFYFSEQMSEEVKKSLNKAKELHIDLRGNFGGRIKNAFLLAGGILSDRRGFETIYSLPFMNNWKETIISNGSLAKVSLLNTGIVDVDLSNNPPFELRELGKDKLKKFKKIKNSNGNRQGSNPNYKKIRIYMDDKCKSTCELFVLMMKRLENVRVFGSRTPGSFQLVSPGIIGLKYSKMIVNIPTVLYMFDKRYEKKGIEPTVLINNISGLSISKLLTLD